MSQEKIWLDADLVSNHLCFVCRSCPKVGEEADDSSKKLRHLQSPPSFMASSNANLSENRYKYKYKYKSSVSPLFFYKLQCKPIWKLHIEMKAQLATILRNTLKNSVFSILSPNCNYQESYRMCSLCVALSAQVRFLITTAGFSHLPDTDTRMRHSCLTHVVT